MSPPKTDLWAAQPSADDRRRSGPTRPNSRRASRGVSRPTPTRGPRAPTPTQGTRIAETIDLETRRATSRELQRRLELRDRVEVRDRRIQLFCGALARPPLRLPFGATTNRKPSITPTGRKRIRKETLTGLTHIRGRNRTANRPKGRNSNPRTDQ